jgi:hypothetical protein
MDALQPLEAVGPAGRSCLAVGVGWLIGLLAPLLATATLWNVIGAVDLGEVDEGYIVRFSGGSLEGREAGGRGAQLVAEWVADRASPSWNPLRILWHQLWYNASTEGSELVLWLEPGDGDLSRRWFAVYQSGQTLFLRLEFKGKNRVLDAAFSADELEQALDPFLFGPDRPAEAVSGESR